VFSIDIIVNFLLQLIHQSRNLKKKDCFFVVVFWGVFGGVFGMGLKYMYLSFAI
jgi:uncharacterized membrane-anchored protein YitT (DUF2179 family)